MDEFHQRLIRIGLDALAADSGYAMAGGYAIQAYHFIERLSDDVDLFVPIERRHEMPTATARIIAAYTYKRAGLHAEVCQQAERSVHVLNAPSPAATASLPIGEEIARCVLTRC